MQKNIEAKLETIEIPAGLHAACTAGIAKGERLMRAKRIRRAAAAAAAVICIAVLPVAASHVFGHFEDIRNGTAVTGQRIADADNDMSISASVSEDGTLDISIRILNEEEVAYRYTESLYAGDIMLISHDGGTAAAFTAEGALENGCAALHINNVQLAPGEYTLRITDMQGLSKADAPLEIQGTWECTFTVE